MSVVLETADPDARAFSMANMSVVLETLDPDARAFSMASRITSCVGGMHDKHFR